MQITVNEAWLEHQWRHTKKEKGVKIEKDGYQLCINTNEKDIVGENLTWLIGSYHSLYLRTSSRNSLIGNFDFIPTDTIIYMVQNGYLHPSDVDHDSIGNFILVKK